MSRPTPIWQPAALSPRSPHHGGLIEPLVRNTGSVDLRSPRGVLRQTSPEPPCSSGSLTIDHLRSPRNGTRQLLPGSARNPGSAVSRTSPDSVYDFTKLRSTDLQRGQTAVRSRGLQSPPIVSDHGSSGCWSPAAVTRSTATPTSDFRSTPASVTRSIGTPPSDFRSTLASNIGTPSSDLRSTTLSAKRGTVVPTLDLPSTPASVTRSTGTPSSDFRSTRSVASVAPSLQGTPSSQLRSARAGAWQRAPEYLHTTPRSDLGIRQPVVRQDMQERVWDPYAATRSRGRGRPATEHSRASSLEVAVADALAPSRGACAGNKAAGSVDAPEVVVWRPKQQPIEQQPVAGGKRPGGALGRSLSPMSAVFQQRRGASDSVEEGQKVNKVVALADEGQEKPADGSLDAMVDKAFQEELYNSGVAGIGVGAISLLALGSFAL